MGQMNKTENIPEAEKLFKKGYVSAATESYTESTPQNPCDVTAIDAPGSLYERKGKIEEPEPANRPARKRLPVPMCWRSGCCRQTALPHP